jgi:hypothetical protein
MEVSVMDCKPFQGKRWTIVYGKYIGIEKLAVNELYKVIQQFVPYVLTVNSDDIDEDKLAGYNIVLIGTGETNRYIARLAECGEVKLNTRKEGFAVKSCKSHFNRENSMIILSGADEISTLYAVYDFEHYYIDPAQYAGFPTNIYTLHNPFIDGMPDFYISSSPAVENRGLWTWGHVIYDYRRYIDNMCRWKMNMLTIWNDYTPLNVPEIIEYARSRGVRIVWGFSWSWGEEVNPTDEEDIKKWTESVINTFRTQYAPYGVDAIYFQTFTETFDETLQGESLARLAVNWVNHIAGRLLELYPDLWIQFGLHALSNSVRNEIDCFKNIDPRITITWEDCGSFPYHYDASIVEKHEETLQLTERISELRGKEEDFGIIVKGMTSLKWSSFEHQKGEFILGETKQKFIDSKVQEKDTYWKYIQANWIKNLNCLVDTVRVVCSKNINRVTIAALAEDGGWEDKVWYPVALFAETLWDPYQSSEEILKKVANNNDVHFA